jgi:hypothetical protein
MRRLRTASVSEYHGSIEYLKGLIKVLPIERAVLKPLTELRITEYPLQVQPDFCLQHPVHKAFHLVGSVRVGCHLRFRPSNVQVIAVDAIKFTIDEKGSDSDRQVQDSADREERPVAARNLFLSVVVMASNPSPHI